MESEKVSILLTMLRKYWLQWLGKHDTQSSNGLSNSKMGANSKRLFSHCLCRIGAPGHIFRALYPMLFIQNFGALLTVYKEMLVSLNPGHELTLDAVRMVVEGKVASHSQESFIGIWEEIIHSRNGREE